MENLKKIREQLKRSDDDVDRLLSKYDRKLDNLLAQQKIPPKRKEEEKE